MRKLNFYNKKGFTLVECIVAIAVFAVMTSMVMIIISSAIDTTRQSISGERDLNQMVEAVENDQSIKMYSAIDSHTLVMKFGEDKSNFSITYDTSDGYMSYMTCHWCDYVGPRYEFLRRIADSSTYKMSDQALKDKYPYTYWFDPILPGETSEFDTYNVPGVTIQAADKAEDTRYSFGTGKEKTFVTYLRKFCCPKCNGLIEPSTVIPLICLTCDHEDNPQTAKDYRDESNPKNSTGFHWDNETSSFYCNECGSSQVIEKGMKDKFGAGAQFEVGGIYANAIRYGNVESPDDTEVKALIVGKRIDNGNEVSGYNVSLDVTDYSAYIPDRYKITISNLTTAVTGGKNINFTIKLPKGYKIPTVEKRDTSGNISYGPNISLTGSKKSDEPIFAFTNGVDSSEGSTITINNCQSGNNIAVSFTLVNEKNEASFDSDYEDEGGLGKYWFRMKDDTNTFSVPRTEANIRSSS